MFIAGYSVAAGATGRLLFGYDSFGNVCGKKNSPVEGAPLSGQDMTLKKHVFFMNSCNLEVKDVRLSSAVLCVSSCPEEQLDTLEELQLFADNNGSFLCVYSLNSINYTQDPKADSLCPRLPVPPRNKNDPPDRPVLWSLSILFCYHQGTAIKGSFLITATRIPRTILMYISSALKGKHGAWSRCVSRCCFCCFWCLDKCLRQFNQNAYAASAINGTDFCTSAQDALKLLSKNSSHFTSVNCFGDFMIFLGKVVVVCFTVFGGLMAFNYNRALQVWAIPLLLAAFFAYLVAHSFLSVFETVLDALFLCFAVDLETNDGSSEKPYFMDQEFLSFIKRINRVNAARAQGAEHSLRNEEGMELQPVV